ncbi:MAG TPA: DUF4296 domain-containing protein [Candidatus Kapabacteria bacterium]|nr:DUF4296 domain-containing protein [Candidatus Kapabacteria bacterium]
MRSKVILFTALVVVGCGKSDKLSPDEIQYVAITMSLAKARSQSNDSLTLNRKFDSVYKKYQTTESEYKASMNGLADKPDRADIIFRAINDSLSKVK